MGKNDFLETKVALVWIAIHRIAKTSLSMSIFLTLNGNIWSADLLATWKTTLNSSQIFSVLYRNFFRWTYFLLYQPFFFWSFMRRETSSKSFVWINWSNVASYMPHSHRNIFSETLGWPKKLLLLLFFPKNKTGFYIMFKSNSEMYLCGLENTGLFNDFLL